MKSHIIIFVVLLMVVTSCDSYLDTPPNKNRSVVPTTTEQLESLLNEFTQFDKESNREILLGTDDFGLLSDIYDNANFIYRIYDVHSATWDTDYVPDNIASYWPDEWKKIFIANLILADLDKVSGDAAEKALLKAESHFVRAYSYYQMVNTFCLPYSEQNKNEPGLPVKQTTSFEESVERSTLEETWKLILQDLKMALEIDKSFDFVDGKYRNWRASSASVNAFAARVYLCIGDYTNALKYAEIALAEHDELIDYNTEMRYSDLDDDITIDGQTYELNYPYTRDLQTDPTDRMEWKELYYYRFLYNSNSWHIPSQSLLDLYDKDFDLRYKYHMVENHSLKRGMTDPVYSYPGYVFFHFNYLPSGPTVAEMILIKAECQVRLKDWSSGISTVNILRSVRMDNQAPSDVINLSAASEDEALRLVLEERRRELPFTQRWIDIRRFNNNDNPNDDVIIQKTFYPYTNNVIEQSKDPITYTLDKQSRKFARPIPNLDIQVSQGAIEQNKY